MRFVFFALLALVPLFSSADDLDVLLRKEMARQKDPALTIAVVKNGRIIRLGAYGYANLDWNQKATKDTRFEIASMSKMFTGAAIRILVDEGKLDPEDLVSKYFGDLPESWKTLRVRHLIDMSMGLKDDWGTDLIPYSADVITDYTDDANVKAFATMKFAAPPGTEFHYCSPAYAMLGMIVTKISGTPFSDFIEERIFKPAGMTETSFNDNSAIVPQRASGYRQKNGKILNGRYLGQYLHSRADVGIISSAQDMAKWDIALEKNLILRDSSVLWADSTADFGKPLDYSYGWFKGTYLGHRSVYHTGGFRTGFTTMITRFPDDGVAIVVMTNCDFSQVRPFTLEIAHKYIPSMPSPRALSAEPDSNRSDTNLCIDALKDGATGKIPDYMTSDAFDPTPMSDNIDFMKDVTGYAFGGRRILPQPIIVHGHRLVRYTAIKLQTAEDTYMASLYWDDQGKIAYVEPTF